MSDVSTKLKADAALIRSTALWARYMAEVDRAAAWYANELRSNSRIGEMVTRGFMWQEALQRVTKIANLLDSIVADAAKAADDKPGQS